MSYGMLYAIEGLDGSGKTTLIDSLKVLNRDKKNVVFTRGLGGTELSNKIRSLVLSDEHFIDHETELFLMISALADVTHRVIKPALKNGYDVICDRFIESTYAYQCGGNNLPFEIVKEALYFTDDLPLVSIYMDYQHLEKNGDRIEKKSSFFHNRVRSFYEKRLKEGFLILPHQL